MRKPAILYLGLFALALGLSGCDESGSITGPEMVPYSAEATFRPASADLTVCELPPGFTGDPVAMPALVAAEGQQSFLGRATSEITFEYCEVTANGVLAGGRFTHTSTTRSDGFSGVWDALFTPPTFAFVANGKAHPIVAEEGTGRFQGIIGYAEGTGTIDPVTGEGTFEVQGEISSPGS